MTFADTRVIDLCVQYPIAGGLLLFLISLTAICFIFFRGDRN